MLGPRRTGAAVFSQVSLFHVRSERTGENLEAIRLSRLGVLVSRGNAASAFISDHRPDHLYSGRISQESLRLGLGGLESLTVGRIDVFFGNNIARLSEALLENWSTDSREEKLPRRSRPPPGGGNRQRPPPQSGHQFIVISLRGPLQSWGRRRSRALLSGGTGGVTF